METIKYSVYKKAGMTAKEKVRNFCLEQGMRDAASIYCDTKNAENEAGDYWIETSEAEVNWCCMGSKTVEQTKTFSVCLNYAIKIATAYNKKYAGKKIEFNK